LALNGFSVEGADYISGLDIKTDEKVVLVAETVFFASM
jgi:hypothetical protein